MNAIKLIVLVLITTLYACKNDKKEDIDSAKKQAKESDVIELEVPLEPKGNSNATGKITFIEDEGMVNMIVELSGLSQGQHAIYIHEKSNGEHLSSSNDLEGKWGAKEGYHIKNLKADAQGNAMLTFATNDWCMGCKDSKKDIIGKAIIVHQKVEDSSAQSSNASDRISCAGIIQ